MPCWGSGLKIWGEDLADPHGCRVTSFVCLKPQRQAFQVFPCLKSLLNLQPQRDSLPKIPQSPLFWIIDLSWFSISWVEAKPPKIVIWLLRPTYDSDIIFFSLDEHSESSYARDLETTPEVEGWALWPKGQNGGGFFTQDAYVKAKGESAWVLFWCVYGSNWFYSPNSYTKHDISIHIIYLHYVTPKSLTHSS